MRSRYAWSVSILTSSKIKVGDLVSWETLTSEERATGVELDPDYGLVISLSRTGHASFSAKVMFLDGETWWVDVDRLELINESRSTGKD